MCIPTSRSFTCYVADWGVWFNQVGIGLSFSQFNPVTMTVKILRERHEPGPELQHKCCKLS